MPVPAEQRIIPLNLKSGEPRQAVGYADIAVWTCPCGQGRPLSGRARDPAKPGEHFLVVCPSCGRQFHVIGGGPEGQSVAVNEVGEAAAAGGSR